ncbi:hypothetical protein FS837_010571 [Tulasnella sp. UAMH 9824]|nr:hypothetical protein FS837_010571 [Tulasnella sp. UAMH 9824]
MGLPDERARGDVASLIGRFEKKTRPSDAAAATSTPPKAIVPNKVVLPVTKPNESSSPAPSWVKKKDTLPPPSPKDKGGVKGTAKDVGVPQPIIPPPEAAPAETTIAAEPEAVETVDLSDEKDDDPIAANVAPIEEPAVEPATADPQDEPSNAPAPATSTTAKQDPLPKTARPGTGGSKAPTATSSGPAKTAKTGATPTKPVRSATSSLNKSKSTPALKKGAESASTTQSRPSTAKAKDTNPPAQPLKPQHTGASTTSNTRRVVTSTATASASGTKAPAATGGAPLVKPQPTRPIKVSQSSTLYAPTASMLAKQRKEEPGPPPSAGKKAAVLTSTTRPRAGSTSGTPTGFKPLQLPMKSSVSASGGTRRMVSVSRTSKPDAPEGEGAAASSSTTSAPGPRAGSPARRTPVKPFPSRSPTKSPLSKAQMGGVARVVKNAAVGAWAGAVAAAGAEAVTSEEELILGGEKTAPEGSGMEAEKAVVPEAQQLDASAPESAAAASSSALGDVKPDGSGPVGASAPTAQPEPEEEQEEAKAGHHTDIEETAAAPSTVDEPTTPEPQASVPIVDATSATPEESEQLQQPEQDEIEQMVSMLEAPRKALHFGASSDEDEDPAPVQQRKTEGSIPDIPSDG